MTGSLFLNFLGEEVWHAAPQGGACLLSGLNRLCIPSSAAAWLRPPKLRLKELCLLAYEAGRLGSQGSKKAGKSQGRRSSRTNATSNHFLWNRVKSSKAAADHTLATAGGSCAVGPVGYKIHHLIHLDNVVDNICIDWVNTPVRPSLFLPFSESLSTIR